MTHFTPTISIAGAGIGGLTLAALLNQRGIQATVFEKSNTPNPLGTGLSIWKNALDILFPLGLKEDIQARACEIKHIEVLNEKGRRLQYLPMSTLGKGEIGYMMHREELHRMLREKIEPHQLCHQSRISGVKQHSDKIEFTVNHKQTLLTDVLVGADGLHSRIREYVLEKDELRYSGEICWRGIASVNHPDQGWLREFQGPGIRAGFSPIDDQRVYWFLTQVSSPDFSLSREEHQAYLTEKFKHWPHDIAGLINATPTDEIYFHPLYDRKPVLRWSKNRVTLLGDAAHPMTPNLGQGACMAIEDAAALTRSISTYENVSSMLQNYEQQQVTRARHMVNASRAMGKLANIRNPFAKLVKEKIMAATPSSMMARQMKKYITP